MNQYIHCNPNYINYKSVEIVRGEIDKIITIIFIFYFRKNLS